MSAHRRHHRPLFLLRVKTLDGIQSLETITASDHKQQTVNDTDPELKTSPVHVGDLRPTVLTQIVFLYAYSSCNQRQQTPVFYQFLYVTKYQNYR